MNDYARQLALYETQEEWVAELARLVHAEERIQVAEANARFDRISFYRELTTFEESAERAGIDVVALRAIAEERVREMTGTN